MGLIRRREAGLVKSKAPVQADGSDRLKEAWPALWEFFTLCKWEDGSDRESGTLMLTFEEGRFRCGLHDRDTGEWGWVSAQTAYEALQAADRALAEDKVDWRAPRGKKRT